MKTRKETLETLHDYALEDKIRIEIKIKELADYPDDQVLEEGIRSTPLGIAKVTKTAKNLRDEYQQEIERLDKVIKIVEELIKEENGRPESKT